MNDQTIDLMEQFPKETSLKISVLKHKSTFRFL